MSATVLEGKPEDKTEEKAARNYVYIPFDTMKCPVTGDVVGSVPGIKRRVLKKWGKEKFDSIDWPPIRTVDGLLVALENMPDENVNLIAERYKLPENASLEDIAKAVVNS